MEKWDLYDDKRQPLNRAHIRGDKIEMEGFHIVVEIWTVNLKSEILFTLRHPDKKMYSNFWGNTGGS